MPAADRANNRIQVLKAHPIWAQVEQPAPVEAEVIE
jgi:hypothetical protein